MEFISPGRPACFRSRSITDSAVGFRSLTSPVPMTKREETRLLNLSRKQRRETLPRNELRELQRLMEKKSSEKPQQSLKHCVTIKISSSKTPALGPRVERY
jgi:hypothetical protein